MYVDKILGGIQCIQTLSRLNRICPPYKKKTFILDFVNEYEEIKKAFSVYYTVTCLSNSLRPESIYELEAKIEGYGIFDDEDVEVIYSEAFDEGRLGGAIMNRLLKAAGHQVIDLWQEEE